MKQRDLSRRAALLLLALAFAPLPPAPAQGLADCEKSLPGEFCRALRDAEVASPEEVSTGLTALVESNPGLVWDCRPESCRVLVVNWMSAEVYRQFWAGKEGRPEQLSIDLWVTAAPAVRDFCRATGLRGPRLDRRLEQLLGLRPNSDKAYFVEFWVEPYDLFRPCPDPEISDHECEPDFRRSRDVTTSEEHVKWFEHMRAMSYTTSGFPWTRLGYTYDWGNRRRRVGLSEFIIRKGATVVLNRKFLTGPYCGAGRLHGQNQSRHRRRGLHRRRPRRAARA